MSFPTAGYYAILPRPEFADWLRSRTDDGMIELLTEPALVNNDEFIGKTAWRASENILRVKLLFLASLRDLDSLIDDEGCKAILGSSEISPTLFDRWWTLQYFDVLCNVKEFMGELTKSIQSVPPTGNPVVDQWIDEIKASST